MVRYEKMYLTVMSCILAIACLPRPAEGQARPL
jgi:hypothetical protein